MVTMTAAVTIRITIPQNPLTLRTCSYSTIEQLHNEIGANTWRHEMHYTTLLNAHRLHVYAQFMQSKYATLLIRKQRQYATRLERWPWKKQ